MNTARIYHEAVARLPEDTDLTFVEHDNQLTDEQIAQCLDGREFDVLNEIDNAFVETRDLAIAEHIEHAIPNPAERAALRGSDLWEDLREQILARDQTAPLTQLMQRSGHRLFRYHLGYDLNPGCYAWTDEEINAAAHAMGEAVGIDYATNEKHLHALVINATCGGSLVVLWTANVDTLLTAANEVHAGYNPTRTISWTNPFLLMYDSFNGSGVDAGPITGTITKPFSPSDCRLDAGPYSWSDICGGLSTSTYKAEWSITVNATVNATEEPG